MVLSRASWEDTFYEKRLVGSRDILLLSPIEALRLSQVPNLRNKIGINRECFVEEIWRSGCSFGVRSDPGILRRCKRVGTIRLHAWTSEYLASSELGIIENGLSMHVA